MKSSHQNHHQRNNDKIPEVTLSRSLNLFSITMIGVGGMIGAGIFVLTGTAAGVAGPALILTFILNGIVTTFTAMAYAELGSAFPEAGGGYLWVKEGLGGSNGFLAGWMSWFAHAVAGSLYALGFGRFFAEIWFMAGVPVFGLPIETFSLILTVLVVLAFMYINYQGVSETGKIGNVITMTKIGVLFLFVIFGIAAMLNTEAWHYRFTDGFLPNGMTGVFIAMGLTFVAFEGYEIIAQSGEEAIDPKRNIPKAIFFSIGLVVIIYLLVGVTAIGAVQPPPGMRGYEYLGQQKEIAIIDVAGQIFPLGIGRVLLLLSGLVSTMSALNATTYSSSRVSFAMGRDHNLPAFFARIDPKRHTPLMAVFMSGGLMILMALSLPIEDVAAAADIMFLLLFLQVNVTVLTLRKKMPDLERGFKVPWMPAIPIIAIVLNSFLAIYLFTFSTIAWYFVIGWLVIGMLAYWGYFSKMEAMEKPKEILMEEVLVSRDYSVLVPVVDQQQARIMGQIGAILAKQNQGEVLALRVVRVPPQLTLGEGRLLLKEGRSYLDTVIQEAKLHEVPVHTIIRLGREVADSIRKTAVENASNLLLLGWPGYTSSEGRSFGSVIDPLVDDPPCDVALVRYRQQRPLRSILVPIAGGVNSRLAVSLAYAMGESGEGGPARVTLMHVVPERPHPSDRVRAEQVLRQACEGFSYGNCQREIVEGENIVETILEQAEGYDLIVVGASPEPLFHNLMVGDIAQQISRKAHVSVVVVKVRSGPLHSFLRQTVLPSSSRVPADNDQIDQEPAEPPLEA